jgi:hypothetical protein
VTPRSRYREAPPAGRYDWPNNGEINERLRCGLLEQADAAEAAGDVALADDLRVRAEQQKRQRNECYRVYENRIRNRNRYLRRGF